MSRKRAGETAMNPIAISALLCCVSAASPTLEVDTASRPVPPRGRWLVVKARRGGIAEKTGEVEFKKTRVELRLGVDCLNCGYRIDTSRSPWSIVLMCLGNPREGVARMQGGMLEICFAPVGSPPPKDFDLNAASLYLLLVPKP